MVTYTKKNSYCICLWGKITVDVYISRGIVMEASTGIIINIKILKKNLTNEKFRDKCVYN